MRGGACRKWRRPCRDWRTHCTRRSAQGDCALLKKKWRRHNRDNQQERAQPDRQRGGDGKRRDANTGTSGGVDGRAGVGADRVSSHLRRRARWSAAGAAGPVGGRTAELYSSVVPTAQGILWHGEPLPAAGVDGAGADPVAGTTALPSAGRMGQTTGAGSNPGSADPAGETETVVPGLGASSPLERGTGQGMDSPAKRHRTVFLLRWPCARISRRPDRFAAPLCGPRAVVSAGHDRLLDQRHGRPALPVREQGSGPRADRHAPTGCASVVRGERGQDAGAATAAGGRSTRPLVHHSVRPGRLQSGVVREDVGEADCHADLSQVSQRGLAEGRVRHAQRPTGRGETVTMKLAERGTRLSNNLWLREIRKLNDSGHQTPILTTNFQAPMTTLVSSLFARWSQENFFRYRREHYSLDRLIEYGTEPIPDAISFVNPEWRKLDSQIRSKTVPRSRLAAQFGALALSEDPTESELHGFQQRNGQLREEIQILDVEIDKLKQLRKNTKHHIPVNSLPEEDRFTRLRTERKHFIDTLKMIAYRAESSMASLLREHLARGGDDARALLRQIFQTEADLTPDLGANTLTVRLHHLTQAAHDQAIEHLLADLNATQTVFPGTSLTLIFKLGHPDFTQIRRS